MLLVLTLGGGVFSMLQSLVVPALPTLQKELDTTPTGVTWVFTAYLVAAAVATPIVGRLGDMFGKKRTSVLVLGVLCFGTLVCALATTLPMLIAGRAIQGVGGALFPLAFGIIRDEFPHRRVASGIAVTSASLGVGAAVGMIVGGPILAHLDYHWLFWIPLMVLLPTLVATALVIPESPVRAPGAVDVVGAVLLSVCLVSLLLAISQGPHWGWSSPLTLGLLGVSAVVGAAWIRAESHTSSPLVDIAMLRLRGVWTTNLVAVLLGFGMLSSFVLIPQFVQAPVSTGYGFGASPTQAGLFLLPNTIAMMIASPVGGSLGNRYGSKLPLVLGATITMLSTAVLAVAHTEAWQIYCATLLLGTGVGLAYASLANLVVESVEPEQTGVAGGMNALARMVGGATGAQIVASIVAASVGADGVAAGWAFTLSFATLTVGLFFCVLASLAVPGRRRSQAPALRLAEAP